MIDIDTAEQILQGGDTHPDILQVLGLELLAEVERLYEMMDVLASFHIVKNVEQGFTQRDWFELVELAKRGEEE